MSILPAIVPACAGCGVCCHLLVELLPGDDHVPASIDLIEMPRLQLTFFSKICGDGITRLFSSSHAGLFISARRNPALNSLLRGIPHGILLEGLDGTEFQKSAS